MDVWGRVLWAEGTAGAKALGGCESGGKDRCAQARKASPSFIVQLPRWGEPIGSNLSFVTSGCVTRNKSLGISVPQFSQL